MISGISLLQKGGIIVYIILFLSFVATAIFIERLIYLTLKKKKFQEIRNSDNCLEKIKWNCENENVEEILENFKENEIKSLYRYTEIFPFTAEVSPMLGLLGTVVGLIKTFMVIESLGGKVDVSALSGGMWEALLTTAVGLTVAIFVVSLQEIVEWMIDGVKQELEELLKYCKKISSSRVCNENKET